jgi:hypothetical protein
VFINNSVGWLGVSVANLSKITGAYNGGSVIVDGVALRATNPGPDTVIDDTRTLPGPGLLPNIDNQSGVSLLM